MVTNLEPVVVENALAQILELHQSLKPIDVVTNW